MQIQFMKDLDKLSIEQIIRLPFFYSLKRAQMRADYLESTSFWEIMFKCNKISTSGSWQLLDLESEQEFVTRFKIIDPKPAPRELVTRILELAGVPFVERNKIIELHKGTFTGALLHRVIEAGVEAVHLQETAILLTLKE